MALPKISQPRKEWFVNADAFIWADLLWRYVARTKAQRVTTGAVGAGLRADVTLTWSTPYLDANYTVQATVVDTSGAGTGLRVERIRSVTATAVVVQVINDSGGPLTGTLHVEAQHD